MDIWVIENCDGVCKTCATKEIALREVLRMLKDYYKENPDDKQELQDYRTLMETYFSPCGEDFYIEEFWLVSKAEFIDK
jgi:Fe-S cluster biogenesis protein NfuA